MLKYNLRSTFWSEDYITGINYFLAQIKNDKDELKQCIRVYEDFSDIWERLVSSISDIHTTVQCNQSVYQNQINIIGGFNDKLKLISVHDINSQCIDSLKSLIFQWEEFESIKAEDLKNNFNNFKKQLDDLVQLKARLAKKAELIRKTHNITLNSSNDESKNSIYNSIKIQFPLELDATLVLNDFSAFYQLIQSMRKSIIQNKRKIPIPGLSNEYFSSESLYEYLLSKYPKMDNSLFNLEKIGQKFFDLEILKSYNDIINVKTKFVSNSYYVWNIQFINKLENSEYSIDEDTSNLNYIFKKVSGSWFEENIETEDDLIEQKIQLERLNHQVYQQWLQLENYRLSLELEFSLGMKRFETLRKRKIESLKISSENLNNILNEKWSLKHITLNSIILEDEMRKLYEKNHGTIGYYNCDHGIRFEIYDSFGKLRKPWLFSTNLSELPSENGLPVILNIILKYLNEYEPCNIINAWSQPLDLVKICNMKRDCLTDFMKSKNHSEIIHHLIEKLSSDPNKLNNLVGFLKRWLLELQDSIVPMAYYHQIKAGLLDGLKNCAAINLKCIVAFSNHFQWLQSYHHDQLTKLFMNNGDIPIYHLFTRTRICKPIDVCEYSNLVMNLFTNSSITTELINNITALDSLTNPKDQCKVTSLYLSEDKLENAIEKSPVSLASNSDEFIPKPFKTNSIENSPVGKRRSGVNILKENITGIPSD